MRLRSRVGGKYAAGAPRTAILVVISSNLPLTGRFPVALADNFSYCLVELCLLDHPMGEHLIHEGQSASACEKLFPPNVRLDVNEPPLYMCL
jgi:hypothetical protein